MNIDFNSDWNDLAKEIHQFNLEKGWWNDYLPDNKLGRESTACMLVVTELAEACEGVRKDLFDDKLPEFKMIDVELADAIIRLLDLAGAYDIKLNRLVIDNRFDNLTPPECLWAIVKDFVNNGISGCFSSCLMLCDIYGIDIRMIIEKKMEYNNIRKDHKLENRQKQGGKKF